MNIMPLFLTISITINSVILHYNAQVYSENSSIFINQNETSTSIFITKHTPSSGISFT